jgi:hypothetical protein
MVALLLGIWAAPAAADTEPLPPGTAVTPRDGQVWTASGAGSFVVYASDYDELPDAFAFTVAATPALDADGLLAAPIDRYTAPAQAGHPGIYEALIRPGAVWMGTPGTYYWQAAYTDDDGDTYASPARALTVLAAPAPDTPAPPAAAAPPAAPLPAAVPRPPDAATVRTAVRRAIHAATHVIPRGLVYRCVPAPAAATCRPSWRGPRARYRGTLRLAFGASAVTAAFAGTRIRHGRARAVTWTTSI